MRSPVRPLVAMLTLVSVLFVLPPPAQGADASPSAAPAASKAAPAKAPSAAPASSATKVTKEQPASAPAAPPAIPVTVDDAVGTFQSIVKSFTSEHVRAGIAGIICILIFIWRRFLSGWLIGKIPSRYLPLLTTGVAFLAALPVAIATDPWSWKTFLWQGLITGAEAMAFWSVIVKFIFPTPEKK